MSGETPDLPCVPELPARGPGADLVGRALALLSEVAPEFAGETTPSGWRLAGRTSGAGSRDMRRAQAWLAEDLDVAEEEYSGASMVKWAQAGPWTLAANVELANGRRLLSDPGALRDLASAYETAVDSQMVRLTRRFAGAGLVLQIDEPSLPGVVAGRIPTVSGLDYYRAVSPDVARHTLARVVSAAHARSALVVLHCCAIPAPIGMLRQTGADAVDVDLTAQSAAGNTGQDEHEVGELFESDTGVVAGVLDGRHPAGSVAAGGVGHGTVQESGVAGSVHTVMALTERLGIPLDAALPRMAVSTPCGLAGISPAGARSTVRGLAQVSAILRKEVA